MPVGIINEAARADDMRREAPSARGTFVARTDCFAEWRAIMNDGPKRGDMVTWKSHGGHAEGKVVKKTYGSDGHQGPSCRGIADQPRISG